MNARKGSDFTFLRCVTKFREKPNWNRWITGLKGTILGPNGLKASFILSVAPHLKAILRVSETPKSHEVQWKVKKGKSGEPKRESSMEKGKGRRVERGPLTDESMESSPLMGNPKSEILAMGNGERRREIWDSAEFMMYMTFRRDPRREFERGKPPSIWSNSKIRNLLDVQQNQRAVGTLGPKRVYDELHLKTRWWRGG